MEDDTREKIEDILRYDQIAEGFLFRENEKCMQIISKNYEMNFTILNRVYNTRLGGIFKEKWEEDFKSTLPKNLCTGYKGNMNLHSCPQPVSRSISLILASENKIVEKKLEEKEPSLLCFGYMTGQYKISFQEFAYKDTKILHYRFGHFNAPICTPRIIKAEYKKKMSIPDTQEAYGLKPENINPDKSIEKMLGVLN